MQCVDCYFLYELNLSVLISNAVDITYIKNKLFKILKVERGAGARMFENCYS